MNNAPFPVIMDDKKIEKDTVQKEPDKTHTQPPLFVHFDKTLPDEKTLAQQRCAFSHYPCDDDDEW